MSFPLLLGPGGHVLGVIAGHGIDDFGGGPQGVEHRAGAAATAADQTDLDFALPARRMDGPQERKVGGRRGAGKGQRRTPEESSPGNSGTVVAWLRIHGSCSRQVVAQKAQAGVETALGDCPLIVGF